MERRSRGIIQRAKDAIDQLRTPKEPPIRAKRWVQHGNLALCTLEEGEIIPYRPVQTLEQVNETLERLKCANVTKVNEGDGLIGVRWIVDYDGFLGIGSGEIPPRMLTFYLDENEMLGYSCSVESEELKSAENKRVTNALQFSRDPNETFSQTMFSYYFLFPFAQEKHAELAPTDSFNFQFEGTEDDDSDVRVRIGGVKFRFIPCMLPNSPINGTVEIEVPDLEHKEF